MKKIVSTFVICVMVVCSICVVGCNNQTVNNDTLYLNALNDVIVAEESDIKPLVELTEESQYANIKDGKVLLITFHHYPNSYKPNTDNENIQYYMWTVTDKEFINWYKNNNNGVTDWHLRFCQLLGMHYNSKNTYFAGVWANLEDVIRPAYATDITKQMKNSFDGTETTDYVNWFNNNYVYSYSATNIELRSPWTRLGYSYDWADNGKKYGLSEFLIKKGSTVHVEFNYSIDEFIEYLKAN